MSKRVRINFESVNKGKWEPLDMSDFYANQKKREKEDRARYEKELTEEKKRVNKMNCPSCKSKKKEHFIQSNNNGIFGPGRASWILNEYYICMNCGIHYSDLNKKEIAKPFKGMI